VPRDTFESSLEYRVEDYIYLSSFSTVFHFHVDSEDAWDEFPPSYLFRSNQTKESSVTHINSLITARHPTHHAQTPLTLILRGSNLPKLLTLHLPARFTASTVESHQELSSQLTKKTSFNMKNKMRRLNNPCCEKYVMRDRQDRLRRGANKSSSTNSGSTLQAYFNLTCSCLHIHVLTCSHDSYLISIHFPSIARWWGHAMKESKLEVDVTHSRLRGNQDNHCTADIGTRFWRREKCRILRFIRDLRYGSFALRSRGRPAQSNPIHFSNLIMLARPQPPQTSGFQFMTLKI